MAMARKSDSLSRVITNASLGVVLWIASGCAATRSAVAAAPTAPTAAPPTTVAKMPASPSHHVSRSSRAVMDSIQCADASDVFKRAHSQFAEQFNLKTDLVVDAASFRVCGNVDRRAVRDTMHVVVINMNPFVFQYTITSRSAPIAETAPAVLFKTILPADFSAVTGSLADLTLQSTARPAFPTPCATQEPVKRGALTAPRATVPGLLKKASSDKASFTTNSAAQRKLREDTRGAMAQIVTAAYAGVSFDDSYAASIDIIVDSLRMYMSAADDYLQLSCVQGTPNGASVAQDTLRLHASITTLTDAATAARDDERQLETVLLEPLNFYRIQRLGPHSGSTRDSVNISRRPIPAMVPGSTADAALGGTASKTVQTKQNASSDTSGHSITIAAPVVQFGYNSFLSIGGAMTVANIPVRSFAPLRKYQASLVPADTVITVIGMNQNDALRVTPMLTMSGRLPRFPSDVFTGFSLVVGTTVNKTSSTNLEYYGGIGADFFDSRVTLGVGYYGGQELGLAAGDSLGQRIPNGQAVPTVTRLVWRPAAQLGFRISY
jgi:hypothetical protein